ncbi:MAG: N-acetylmuramic acid 6-phosphate etherase [Vulcanimicrobiaceae bacterium]
MSEIPTEGEHPQSADLDLLSTQALVALFIGLQRRAVDAAAAQITGIATVVDEIAARLDAGGRLHYVGAGTSGRLAMLDAAELPPTFGTAPELVRVHLAGGADALQHAVEGAEDDGQAGAQAIHDAVTPGDAVVGLSASGGAPFVVRAVAAARALGAYTVAITGVEESPLARAAQQVIIISTGAEPLSGSTRLTAGTAQKIVLNALSTAVMVRLGRVYGNAMVDVRPTNEKLRARAVRLTMRLGSSPTQPRRAITQEQALALLGRAEWNVKVAVVMARCNLDVDAARRLLAVHRDRLREVLAQSELRA